MNATHSPRTSVDNTVQSPTSPLFKHSLTQRLRKGSTASRASSQSSEAPSHADLDKTHDARSAKRFLLSILRDDWEFPITQSHKDDLKIQREASGYCFREEPLSEYESEDRKRWAGHEDNPYRFETPDDISVLIERKKARRKRLVEQEMSWNDGLRIWILRRDAWTGAMPSKPVPKPQRSSLSPKVSSKEHIHRNSSDSTGRSSGSAPSWPLPVPTIAPELQDPSDNVVPSANLEQQEHPDGPYLPIYPPLLPASHALRSRIRPMAYPTLYSKVVVLNLTPNVPIPLTHMIGALVDGWKSEGNWPPQVPEPTRLSTRRKLKSESAFQKWKRDQEEKRSAAMARADEVQWEQEEPEHKGVRRSISSAMKKMLGSGSSAEQKEQNIDRDLEKIGLTFETDPELEEVPTALRNGHV